MTINRKRKIAIIGCEFVGASSAFALMQSGLFTEIVLLDANGDKADGEAKDLSHGVPLGRSMKIYAGNYDDIADSEIIVITAGANQKPNETRLDLVHKNVAIFKSIIQNSLFIGRVKKSHEIAMGLFMNIGSYNTSTPISK